MNAQIEELIKMSIIDGEIPPEKLEIIKTKAKSLGIEEGELMIYIDHLLIKSKDSLQNQLSDLTAKGKEEAAKHIKDIKEKLGDVDIEKAKSKGLGLFKRLWSNSKTSKVIIVLILIAGLFKLCNDPRKEYTIFEFANKYETEAINITRKGRLHYYNLCRYLVVDQKSRKPITGNFKLIIGQKDIYLDIRKVVITRADQYNDSGKTIKKEGGFDKKNRLLKEKEYFYGYKDGKLKYAELEITEYNDDCGPVKMTTMYFKENSRKFHIKKIGSGGFSSDKKPTEYYDAKGNSITESEYDKARSMLHDEVMYGN